MHSSWLHPREVYRGGGISIWVADGCTPSPPTGSMQPAPSKTDGQQAGGMHPTAMHTCYRPHMEYGEGNVFTHFVYRGGRVCLPTMSQCQADPRPVPDTVNRRWVRILLECSLVSHNFMGFQNDTILHASIMLCTS